MFGRAPAVVWPAGTLGDPRFEHRNLLGREGFAFGRHPVFGVLGGDQAEEQGCGGVAWGDDFFTAIGGLLGPVEVVEGDASFAGFSVMAVGAAVLEDGLDLVEEVDGSGVEEGGHAQGEAEGDKAGEGQGEEHGSWATHLKHRWGEQVSRRDGWAWRAGMGLGCVWIHFWSWVSIDPWRVGSIFGEGFVGLRVLLVAGCAPGACWASHHLPLTFILPYGHRIPPSSFLSAKSSHRRRRAADFAFAAVVSAGRAECRDSFGVHRVRNSVAGFVEGVLGAAEHPGGGGV